MRPVRSLVVALAIFAALALAAAPVLAEDALPPAPMPARVSIPPDPSSDASLTSTPGPKSPLKEPDKTRPRYWALGDARAFTSLAIDVGFLYFRPRVSFGYGRPFWQWVGVDVNPQVSSSFTAAYAGLRLALPMVDFRVGPRFVFAFQHHFLEKHSNFSRLQFESQEQARAQYLAMEAEVTSAIPAGPGSILAAASGTYLAGVPNGLLVYEETLRIIADAPWIWRGRLGYAVRLGVEGKISFGPVCDILGNPGRGIAILRGGVVGSAALSNHIDVLGSLVVPINSPDTLGIYGGDFAQLGVRYRWATGQATDIPVERME
jgi:hypothetical protein